MTAACVALASFLLALGVAALVDYVLNLLGDRFPEEQDEHTTSWRDRC